MQTITYSVMNMFKKASDSTVRLNQRNSSTMFLDFSTDKYFSIKRLHNKGVYICFQIYGSKSSCNVYPRISKDLNLS